MRNHQIKRELTVKNPSAPTSYQPPIDKEEERELLERIQQDPDFVKTLSKEKAFRLFIQAKVPRQRPSQELIDSIKESIRREAAREIGL